MFLLGCNHEKVERKHFNKNLPGPYQRTSAKLNSYSPGPLWISALMLMSLTNILLDDLPKTCMGIEKLYGWD